MDNASDNNNNAPTNTQQRPVFQVLLIGYGLAGKTFHSYLIRYQQKKATDQKEPILQLAGIVVRNKERSELVHKDFQGMLTSVWTI